MKGAGQPHRVKIKIRHHDRKFGPDFIPRDQMGDDLRRHEVGADGDVGLHVGKKPDERAGVEAIQQKSHPVGLPWFVAPFVPPAEQRGGILHQLDVQLGVKVPEKFVGEGQRIHVGHLIDARTVPTHLLQRRRRPEMAGARAGGKDENLVPGRRHGNSLSGLGAGKTPKREVRQRGRVRPVFAFSGPGGCPADGCAQVSPPHSLRPPPAPSKFPQPG